MILGNPVQQQPLYLHKLRFNSIPSFSLASTCNPVFSVTQNGRKVFFSKDLKGKKEKDTVEFFARELRVTGDIKIEFFHATTTNRMFSLAFNTNYETLDAHGKIPFKRSELDRACLDNTHKNFQANFALEVFLLTEEVQEEMRRGTLSSQSVPQHITKYDSKKSPVAASLTADLKRSLTPLTKTNTNSPAPVPQLVSQSKHRSGTVARPLETASSRPDMFSLRQATNRPYSADLTGQVRNGLTRTEAFKQRPASLILPKLTQAKRELIIPLKPPASVRRAYFSFQRTDTSVQAPSPKFVTPSVPAPSPPPACPICEKSLARGFTIEIFVGTTIHVECMKCGTCGRALEGENEQSILQEGKITCHSCAKDLFPSCKICTKLIRDNAFRSAIGESYHKNCFICCECETDLTKQRYYSHNKMAYCHPCAKSKRICAPPQAEAATQPTPEETDLREIMKTELQKKHFRTFLQQKGIESVLNHYEDVNLRKGLSAGEREEMASDIQCRYLSEAGINKLPEEIRLKVIEINQKDSVHFNNASKNLFKNSQTIVFQELAKHVHEFTKSQNFSEFLTDLGEKPDEEEEEEDLRRSRIAKFIPIVPTDLPLIQAKRPPEPDEEELRIAEEEEARRQKEEEEARRQQEEEERLRLQEEQRLRYEKDRKKREEEESKKAEDEKRRTEEENNRLEEQKKLEALKSSENRMLEERKRMQAQREADARFLEEKRKEHEAALEKVRTAQIRAQEASKKAKEVSRQNEQIVKQQQSMPLQAATVTGSCAACNHNLFSTDVVVKSQAGTVHNGCFKCVQCQVMLANQPYVFLENNFWCVSDYSAIKALRCVGCTGAIFGTDHTEIQGESWHKNCVKCTHCNRTMGVIDNPHFFVDTKKRLSCSECAGK